MGQTLAEKILSDKMGYPVHAGETIVPQVDFAGLHDGSGPGRKATGSARFSVNRDTVLSRMVHPIGETRRTVFTQFPAGFPRCHALFGPFLADCYEMPTSEVCGLFCRPSPLPSEAFIGLKRFNTRREKYYAKAML